MIVAHFAGKSAYKKTLSILDGFVKQDAYGQKRSWFFKKKRTSKDGSETKYIFQGSFKGASATMEIVPTDTCVLVEFKTKSSQALIGSRVIYFIVEHLGKVTSTIEWQRVE